MLLPNRVKFRKMHRLPLRGKATRGTHIAFGDFAMQATSAGRGRVGRSKLHVSP